LRLTEIKLAGFKSFVDPTHIPVPGQLVGIVGPNGCGKSNVIDAVRWVLGESSARHLRGDTMQDVLFNGAGNRQSVNRASVELIFDNSLGRAGGQWANYAEISVKRVLERDAESFFYINNIHVRRRDIADIFLGTGLGARAYAIVEQGMISRIIEAKPEELRIFLEEAAGVSKYRERRRETELRLADTRENLLRVEDIRLELDKQLEHLRGQAEVATQYHSLQQQLHTTQNLLWLQKKREAGAARERCTRDIEKLGVELEAETARLRETERKLEELRAGHHAAGETVPKKYSLRGNAPGTPRHPQSSYGFPADLRHGSADGLCRKNRISIYIRQTQSICLVVDPRTATFFLVPQRRGIRLFSLRAHDRLHRADDNLVTLLPSLSLRLPRLAVSAGAHPHNHRSSFSQRCSGRRCARVDVGFHY